MAVRQTPVAAADWQRCKEVFGEVLCLPDEAREDRLDTACRGDALLSRAVRELLDGHARSGAFLDPPVLARSLQARLFLGPFDEGSEDDLAEGTVLAGRYRLGARIGTGASGHVRAAEDLLTGERVACKILRREAEGALPGAFRAETAALRLLRIPGVVRMIEEGAEEGRLFVVTDLVEGSPFPGVDRPARWERIAGTVVSLLETLGRIHQAGFVHRDLKPANVLVDAEGRPTVLDLGVALHPREAGRADGAVVGTPNYLPPEQFRGDAATPRSDLFSVGVMLYEALAGKLPHRAGTAPSPLRDCPAAVADLVSRLLDPDPDRRPRTASEALSLIPGTQPGAEPERLPWLGSDAGVRAIVAAAERGESLDLSGAQGSGRTRCLAEAAERLNRAGRRVLRFLPGDGFSALVDAAETAALSRLDEAKDLARSRLAAALREGCVALADDAERLEPWVAEVLAECRAHGTVVRALPAGALGALPLRPLSRADLMDLFHGPDRVFHLREDAAGILLARSRGAAGAVAEDVAAWVRAGTARWEEGRLAVSREAIDRLLASAPDEPRGVRRDLRGLPEKLRKLAAAVQIAGGQATPEGLAPVLREPAWQVEARLHELRALDVVRYAQGGPAEPCAPVDVLSALTQEEVGAAHARLAAALPEGHEDRIRHLVAARDLVAIPGEARLLARRRLEDGRHMSAIPLLEQALVVFREHPARPDPLPLLEDLMIAGLLSWSAPPLDRTLYELEMTQEQGPRVRRLADLVRSALSLLQGTWERSLVTLERMEPFPEARIELVRQTLRVLAARRGGIARERAAVAAVSHWAETCGYPEARRSLVVWLAWLRHNEGRFDEAARLHSQAAELAADPVSRVSSLTSRVTALMDDYRLDEAMEAAQEALRAMAAVRDPTAEARLLSNQRSIEYRLGVADAIDPDLPDIVGRTGVREMEAPAALTEAAVAWRLGNPGVARRFASRAARLWTELGLPYAVLPRALLIANSPDAGEAEVLDVAAKCASCPRPGVVVQTLGLLAIARPDLSSALVIPDAVLKALPRRTWGVRREVLSVMEALNRRVERKDGDGSAGNEWDLRRETGADGLRP